MANSARRSTRTRHQACPRCGAPVRRQTVGRTCALTTTADAEPRPLDELLKLAGPNRLVWCAVALHSGSWELRWLHGPGYECPHQHVIDHQCASADQQVVGTLW